MSTLARNDQSLRKPTDDNEPAGPLARLSLAVLGAALIVAAFGMWVVGGANWSSELLLMKLGASVFLALTGATCMITARQGVL